LPPSFQIKSEIRITKSETNPNPRNPKRPARTPAEVIVLKPGEETVL
jgi:hypothetical protein